MGVRPFEVKKNPQGTHATEFRRRMKTRKNFVRGRLMRLEWTSSSSRVFHSSTLTYGFASLPCIPFGKKKLLRSIHNLTRGALGTTEETHGRSIVLVDVF